jgi:WD40 repeat protein
MSNLPAGNQSRAVVYNA